MEEVSKIKHVSVAEQMDIDCMKFVSEKSMLAFVSELP